MLIIPTEKRFDWQRAPVMLFFIVVANCLIFFFYQSGDQAKYFEALQRYNTSNLFSLEWPQYQRYLESRGETRELIRHRNSLEQDNPAPVWMALLRDKHFYHWLKAERDSFLTPDQIDDWQRERADIHALIFNTSVLRFGLTPSELDMFSLLSHQFLHGGFMHLLGNMFFLVICGFAVEASIGAWRFLSFYLLSGVAGGLLFVASAPDSSLPLVGASGAISGVMAMYVTAFRLRKIEFFYWFFIFVGYVRAPALLILGFYIGKEALDYYTTPGSNVAYMAHIGGFLAGGALILGALFFNRTMFNHHYLDEDQNTDPQQAHLAQIYALMEKYRFRAALKSLEELTAQYGNSFEMQRLRYTLMNALPTRDLPHCVHTILRHKPVDERELAMLHKVWRENPSLSSALDAEGQLRLALNFSTPEHHKTAEAIFTSLRKDSAHRSELGILARKLSVCFAQLNNAAKQKEYAAFADQSVGAAR